MNLGSTSKPLKGSQPGGASSCEIKCGNLSVLSKGRSINGNTERSCYLSGYVGVWGSKTRTERSKNECVTKDGAATVNWKQTFTLVVAPREVKRYRKGKRRGKNAT